MSNTNAVSVYEKDIFISYSSMDSSLVLDFVNNLERSGISYFLDKIDIGWGQEIIERVSDGIERSRYVVLFVSEKSIESNWVKKEVHLAMQKEIESGSNVILPILGCGPEAYFERFPFMKTKKYLEIKDGESMVQELVNVLRGTSSRNYVFNHYRHYHGPVWIRLFSEKEHSGSVHGIKIRWGPWYRECDVTLFFDKPVFLTHSKGNDGESLPIILDADSAVYASIGQGVPNSSDCVNINRFWVAGLSRVKTWIAKTFLWP